MRCSRHLVDMVRGVDTVELSTILKGDARFLTFTAKKEDAGPIGQLNLPEDARVVFFYRDDRFFFAEADTKLREGDEVIILTHSKMSVLLRNGGMPKRWTIKTNKKEAIQRLPAFF